MQVGSKAFNRGGVSISPKDDKKKQYY